MLFWCSFKAISISPLALFVHSWVPPPLGTSQEQPLFTHIRSSRTFCSLLSGTLKFIPPLLAEYFGRFQWPSHEISTLPIVHTTLMLWKSCLRESWCFASRFSCDFSRPDNPAPASTSTFTKHPFTPHIYGRKTGQQLRSLDVHEPLNPKGKPVYRPRSKCPRAGSLLASPFFAFPPLFCVPKFNEIPRFSVTQNAIISQIGKFAVQFSQQLLFWRCSGPLSWTNRDRLRNQKDYWAIGFMDFDRAFPSTICWFSSHSLLISCPR